MQRKINFNAGPAVMPAEVLEQASAAVKEYRNTGMSILELSHRGKEFMEIVEESKSLVRDLCNLDDDFEVLWLQGGGRMQFCMIPMNFLGDQDAAGYIDSGRWAEEALEYATHYGDVQILATAKDTNYDRLPEWPAGISPNLSYVHFTTNNTIYGTQWQHVPSVNVPLIADMSSDILSRKHDYNKYAMFYAAVQKNLGTPGVALVAIRKGMLDRTSRELPPMLSYKAQVKENSILNTANVFGIYTSLLMLRWIKQTGLDVIEEANIRKAKLLYDALERSKKFKLHVANAAHRSMMNVCFTAVNEEIEKSFLALCQQNNIAGIKGHRSVGGFRVSLYNAVTLEDVKHLVELINS